MPLFRPLSTVSLQDLPEVGGKAARLGEALRLGAPVLPGVVLSTELYRRFMRQGGLQGEVASILATMQPRTITHFQAVEWAIRSAFQVRRAPEEVSRTIREAWRSMGGVSVAVRSSATNEDSPEQSFVGQHATYLDVDSEDRAIEAVLGCWMSLFSAKALAYAQTFGVDLLSSSMAVLMQPMIVPQVRGALFTADPITGNPDRFVLETRSDDRATLHILDPYERQPGEQATWSQLRHLGLLLDEHHLAYQAIEWTVADDDKLYVLRVRPLTKVPAYLPVSANEIGAGHNELELVAPPSSTPRAMRPFSWYHRSRSPAMNAAYFRGVNRLFTPYSGRDDFFIFGYLYVYRRLFAISPPEEAGPLRDWFFRLRRLYKARILDREQRALFREERPMLDALRDQKLGVLSARQLAEHLRQLIDIGDAFWAERGKLQNVPQALRDIFCHLHRTWLQDEPDCETLLWAACDPRMRWEDALYTLATESYGSADEEGQALGDFMARYGHFFLGEGPLAEWRDLCSLEPDESAVRARLKYMKQRLAEGKLVSPEKGRERRQREQALLEHRVLNRLGRLKRAAYLQVLRLARRYVPLEVQLDEPVRLARMLERRAVYEVGRRLVAGGLAREPQDACLLGFQEILNWLDGSMQRDEVVRALLERKELLRRWYRYSPPRRLRVEPLAIEPVLDIKADSDLVLRGTPVSPGVASGPARVVNTLAESTSILPGEILVCREPLFELSPLFSIVAAVVAEQGGLLEHAGVLAREYSVPAVFGVREATRRIKTGEKLVVDANNGVVVQKRVEAEWDVFQ
ncbi:MAG: hypothetical protein H5T69_09475 [Chloroflexi bacterium]|nr:hypothetical protein [Chloroflexota bacterium]